MVLQMSDDKLKSLLEQIDILAMNLDSFAAVISGLIESIRESGIPEETISRFENLSNALTEQKKDLRELGEKLSGLFDQISKELEEKKTQTEQLQAKLADSEKEVNELKSKVDQLENELNKAKSEIDEKASKIQELEKSIEEYKARIRGLEEEISKARSQIESKDLEITKLKSELNDAKKRIGELEGSVSEKESRISDLKSKVQSLEEEIRKLKADYEAKISDLNKSIEERNIEISNLKNKITSLENTVNEKEKQLSEAKEIIVRYEKEVAAVEFARALIATHPDAHILRALPVMLSIGVESEGFVCADQTKFMAQTKKTFHAIGPLLSRVFKPEWYKFIHGIPPRLCVRKDILESIRIIFEG